MQNKYVEHYIEQDILFGKYQKDIVISLEIAKELVEERLAFQNGKDYPVVVDMNGIKKATKEARIYLGKEGIKGISIGAFIVKNAFERVMTNFFLEIESPPIPAKAFTNIDDAVKWINEVRIKLK